jgi:hypothetical protein
LKKINMKISVLDNNSVGKTIGADYDKLGYLVVYEAVK